MPLAIPAGLADGKQTALSRNAIFALKLLWIESINGSNNSLVKLKLLSLIFSPNVFKNSLPPKSDIKKCITIKFKRKVATIETK